MRGHAAVKWLVASALVWVVAAWPVSAQHHLGHGVGHHFGHIGHGSGIHLHLGAHHHHGVGLGYYAVYRRPLIPSYRQYLVHTPHWRYTPYYGLHRYYYRSYYGGWYGYGWPGYGCYYPPLYYPPALYCWPTVLPSYCSSIFIWQPLVVATPYVVGVEKKDGQMVPRRRPAAADDVLVNLGPGRQAVDGQDLVGMMNVLKAQELAERARRRRGEAQQNELARFLNIGRAEAAGEDKGEAARTLAQLEADARRVWKSGRYRDAADRYEELVERHPGRVEYWLRLGFSALDAQDWQRSLAAFRSAARLKGDLAADDFDLAVWYGDSSLKLRQLDQVAQAALRQPDNPDLWLLVGTFLWFDGQTDRAGRFLAKAQDLARGDQPLLLVQAMKR